jgi:uncharacterized protein
MAPASFEFQVMVKPGGAVCNLDCAYCYYLAKRALYPDDVTCRMSEELLEALIEQTLDAHPGGTVNFAWHGGEPTALGLDYFRTVVALQRKHARAGRRIANSLQTNGTLVDDAWARFLAAEGFFVGLSLDGPADVHDPYRQTRGRRPSHAHAVRAFRLLRAWDVPCDVLSVVHDRTVARPTAVYRFFKELGVPYLQFLPLVEPGPGGDVSARTPSPEAFGEFLCVIFDEWVRGDVGRVVIQAFDEAIRAACGLPHALCVFRETCGDVPVVEWNGDVFSCDHFVDPGHRLGTILDTPLAEILEGPAQRAFGAAKRDALPRACRQCAVLDLCHGGCPKDRAFRTAHGEVGLNALCGGWTRFFSHARPQLDRFAALWRSGQPLVRIMGAMGGGAPMAAAARNHPCPCGSGRKHKRCCGAKKS